MPAEVTGLPLAEAETVLRAAGIGYTLKRTAAPFGRGPEAGKRYRDYAVRFEQGELTYASFPVLSIMTEEPQEGRT